MKINARRMTFCALLTAIALTIFMVEAQIPLPVAIPGMKLGLANVVTVYAMFALGPADTLMILLARVFLGSLFAGGSTLIYSLAGGLLCYVSMLFMRKVLTEGQLWVCGSIGSIFHNVGQVGVASLFNRTPQLFVAYFPVLVIPGVIAGALTGLAAQLVLKRLGNRFRFDPDKK